MPDPIIPHLRLLEIIAPLFTTQAMTDEAALKEEVIAIKRQREAGSTHQLDCALALCIGEDPEVTKIETKLRIDGVNYNVRVHIQEGKRTL